MKKYPVTKDSNPDTIKKSLDFIQRARLEDIGDRNNLPNLFIGGRKVSKVPSSSSDITGSAAGDFNVTASFAFFCINNSGTVEWVRVAVGTF